MDEALAPPTPDETEAPAPPPVKYMRATGEAIMADPTGEVYTIDPSKVGEASRSGWRPVSEMEYESAKEGGWGTARAFVEGAARTVVPINVFDPLAVEASRLVYGDKGAELARQQLREDEQMHPTATFAGEVAGSLAPLAFGVGGGSAAATGETFLARAGQRFLQEAPRAFAMGAQVGFGQQVHEDVLGNHDAAAQKYLASTLKGGLMAVLIGGGMSAGLGAASDKLAGLRGPAARAEGGAVQAIERAAEREGNALSRQAELQAFKATGAMKGDWRRLGETVEEITGSAEQYGRRLLNEGIVTAGASRPTIAARAAAKLEEAGREIGTLRKSLERSTVRPVMANIAERFERDVAVPMRAMPLGEGEVVPAARYLADMVEKGGEAPSFDQLWKYKKHLDGLLEGEYARLPSAPQKQGAEAMLKLRGLVRDEYEAAAERASVDLGEDIATKYRLANARYGELADIVSITTKSAAGDAAHRAISLSDNMWGGAGFVALGPKGLALALANKGLREYGNQAAAVALDRIANVDTIAKAAQAFDRRLDQSVLSFFGKAKPPALARSTERVSPEAMRALRDATRQPAVLADRVATAVAGSGLRETAPNVTRAMTGTIMRAATWIQAKLPPEPPPRALAFGPSKPRPVGPRAQKEINNAFRALDADAFMDDLARGRVDRQALEAMKFINPELHMEVVGKLRRYGLENQPDLSRQQAVALSIITGEPMTPLMQPKTIQGFQQAYAQEEPPHDPSAPGQMEKKQIGPGGPPPGRAQGSRAFASGTDKLEGGNDGS